MHRTRQLYSLVVQRTGPMLREPGTGSFPVIWDAGMWVPGALNRVLGFGCLKYDLLRALIVGRMGGW